jgi:chromosome segregation ATPase
MPAFTNNTATAHTDSNNNEEHSLTPISNLMRTRRDQEKQQLGQLNDRFAAYIARAKFLEGQNKKLAAELTDLKQNWSADTHAIKEQYEPELAEARATIDASARQRATADIASKRAEYALFEQRREHDLALHEHQTYRTRIACLEQLLGDNERECAALRAQVGDVEQGVERGRNETRRLADELRRLLEELDVETLRRLTAQNQKQTLEEQLTFQKALFEHEMNEIRSMFTAANFDPVQFYRSE